MIETERLLLREYTPDDFNALYEIVSDPETMAHYPAPFDEARTRRWIDWNLENYAQYGFGLWAVVLNETGEFIGDCGLTLQNIDGEMLPEIGYHIHRKYWRRGFAKEAARAVRDWAFSNTGYNVLYSYMKYTNEGSWRTALANGMKKVKEYPDPKNTISYAFAITREEWEKRKTVERFPGIGCAWTNAAGKESAEYFGEADRENHIAVTDQTIFPACSISKFVTAICIMKLHGKQVIDIDKPVNDYLRQWKLLTLEEKESDASVRALLCHTAGIMDGDDGFYGLRRGDPEVIRTALHTDGSAQRHPVLQPGNDIPGIKEQFCKGGSRIFPEFRLTGMRCLSLKADGQPFRSRLCEISAVDDAFFGESAAVVESVDLRNSFFTDKFRASFSALTDLLRRLKDQINRPLDRHCASPHNAAECPSCPHLCAIPGFIDA